MYLLSKYIDDIKEIDILRLMNNIAESKALDYKQKLNITNDKDKKEFLFDVASMANTDGGVIIYGIGEGKDESGKNSGLPQNVVGIDIPNKDKLTQQIEDLIQHNTDPRVNSIGIRFLLVEGKEIMILGIKKYLDLPHMVTFNASNKFYKRRNSGKYLLETRELNNLFMDNYLKRDKIKSFIQERISFVKEGELLPTLDVNSSLFVHIIPLSFFGQDIIDISNHATYDFISKSITPHYGGTANWLRYNIDGLLSYPGNPIDYSYWQAFRDGVFESYLSLEHVRKFYFAHCSYSPQDSVNIGANRPASRTFYGSFIIFDQSAAKITPGNGSFNDPSNGYDLESFGVSDLTSYLKINS